MQTDAALSLSEIASAAIKACGGAVPLSKRLGITKGAVYQWERCKIPAEKVGHVAAISGIPPHELRPDVFPAPADAREGV